MEAELPVAVPPGGAGREIFTRDEGQIIPFLGNPALPEVIPLRGDQVALAHDLVALNDGINNIFRYTYT